MDCRKNAQCIIMGTLAPFLADDNLRATRAARWSRGRRALPISHAEKRRSNRPDQAITFGLVTTTLAHQAAGMSPAKTEGKDLLGTVRRWEPLASNGYVECVAFSTKVGRCNGLFNLSYVKLR